MKAIIQPMKCAHGVPLILYGYYYYLLDCLYRVYKIVNVIVILWLVFVVIFGHS